jgi:hypothetical protein
MRVVGEHGILLPDVGLTLADLPSVHGAALHGHGAVPAHNRHRDSHTTYPSATQHCDYGILFARRSAGSDSPLRTCRPFMGRGCMAMGP